MKPLHSLPLLLFLFFFLFLLVSPTAATPPQNLTACLSAANITQVLPTSPNYAIASEVFNARITTHPAVVAYATSANDVSLIVGCAAPLGLFVVPRSGGHSYEGYATGGRDGAVVVDLSGINATVVDNTTSTARVGAGSRLGPVYLAVAQHGYGISMGTCADVGVGGLTLGGGEGYYSRAWGLALDQLVEVEVVLANGTMVTANGETNADLFWSLRGAGAGSFGIVTEFTFQLSKAPAQVTTFFYGWDPSVSATVMMAFQAWGANPGSPNIGVALAVDNTGPQLMGAYLGPQATFEQYIQTLLSQTPNTTSATIQEVDFITSVLLLSGLDSSTNISDLALTGPLPPRDNFKATSLLVPQAAPLPAAAYTLIAKMLSSPPAGSPQAWLEIDLWGGVGSAINTVAANATSFSHRSSLLCLQFYVDSTNAGTPLSSQAIAWVKNITNAVAPYIGTAPEAYQNYIDSDIIGWQQAYYGSNYPILQTIKTKYDPNGVFTIPQGIVGTNGTGIGTTASASTSASESLSTSPTKSDARRTSVCSSTLLLVLGIVGVIMMI